MKTETSVFYQRAYCRLFEKANLKVITLLLVLFFRIDAYADNPATQTDSSVDDISTINQATGKVTGKVTDTSGEALPGVTVRVKGTQKAVITNMDGVYTLSDVPSNSTIVFSYISMTTQEVAVQGQGTINVVMKEDVIGLEEVTTIGYVTMKKKDISGAVSTINSEQILRVPSNNIRSALVNIPGVRIDGDKIRIRGNRSVLAKNDPLIILDGMPYGEPLESIDPNDVESIDVLKDASSTALYGSQGANGVIIITTKKGKVGKTSVTYNAFAGWGVTNWHNFRPMNANEYIAFMRECYRAAGTWHDESDDSKVFLGNEIANMGKLDENWMDAYLGKNRFWTDQTVTIASGNEKTQYKISLNYKNDESRMKNAGKNRFFLTTDIDHQVFDRLKVGVSNRLYYYVGKDKPDPFGGLLNMSPLTPIYNEDGSLNATPTGDPYVKNPFLSTNDEYYKDKTEEWKMFIKAYAHFDILDGLSFRTNFSYNPAFSARGYYYDDRSNNHRDSRNAAGVHNNRKADYVWNNILNYRRTFGIHGIDAFAVYEIQNRTHTNTAASGRDQELPSYLWYNLGRLSDSKTLSSGFTRSQMISYVGRMQYTLMDRYIATITVRQDGASQLTKDDRWDFFPSFALAWRLSEEEFIKKYSFISNLKLRGSYGITGNNSVDPYRTLGELYSAYVTFYNNGGEVHYTGMEPSVRPTPELRWEKTKMVNLGLDFGFLNGRISGSVDYYRSNTDDLLNERKLPYTSGYNKAWENIGKTRNRGWEVTLNTVPVETKDFRLGVNLIFYTNKEELTELYDPNLDKDIQNGWWLGYPVNGVFYDLKQAGIWQENEANVAAVYGQKPGEVKVVDLDGNGKIDGDDRMILGTNRPDWTGSLTITADYKDFDFSMDCYGEFGAMAHDGWSTGSWASQMGRWNAVKVDYWTPEKPNNKHPRPVAGQEIKYINSVGYHKNDYISIRQMTLGYSLPKKLLGNVLERTRFYFTVTEPFRYSKFKREGGLYYNESFYLLGVNVQF